MLRPEEVQHFKEFLSKGDLKSCLKKLSELADRLHEVESEIFMLSARFTQLERHNSEGTLDYDDYERKFLTIQKSVYSLIDRLADKGSNGKSPTQSPNAVILSTFRISDSNTDSQISINPFGEKVRFLFAILGLITFILIGIGLMFYSVYPDIKRTILVQDYDWEIYSDEIKNYGVLKVDMIKRQDSIQNIEFSYNLNPHFTPEFCIADSMNPLRIKSENGYIKRGDIRTFSKLYGDCSKGKIQVLTKKAEKFSLLIHFFPFKESANKKELDLLYEGLGITEKYKHTPFGGDRISIKKMTLAERISIQSNLFISMVIFWTIFIICSLIFLYWKGRK